MLLGMKESYKKGESESILAPSLAGVVARRQSKRRQGYRWAWVIELRKTLNWDAEPYFRRGKQHGRSRQIASDRLALRSLRTPAR